MWICNPCGKENRDDRTHCWKCSTPKGEIAVLDERPAGPLETDNSPSDPDSRLVNVSSVPSQPSESTPAEHTDTTFPTETIYKHTSIWLGSFLGGPLVAAYIIARNFKAFGESQKAWLTWIIAIIATGVIFAVAFSLPDTNSKFIPALYTGIAYVIIRQYQGAKIDAHIDAGGATHGWPNVLVISIVGLIVTFIPVVVIGVAVMDPGETEQFSSVQATDSTSPRRYAESPTFKTYQALKHEIYFLQSNISVEEIDKVAAALTRTGFFDDVSQKQIFVRKVNDNYELTIPCSSEITTNPNAHKVFIPWRKNLQQSFPGNKIILNLVVDSFDKVEKRIE